MWKAIFLGVIFILVVFWTTSMIVGNWDYWEDKYYAHKLKRDPARHDYCVKDDCGRPRPHKKMSWVKAGTCGNSKEGNVCDRHLGLME